MAAKARTKLTDKQKAVLDFIKKYIRKHDFAPTLREMAEALGYPAPPAVSNHLMALERKEYIRRENNKSRAIEVL